MRFTREELRRLLAPLAIAMALVLAGAAFIWSANGALAAAQRQLLAAQAERRQNAERLARIAEEEREVSQKIDLYRRLKNLNILGDEQRLEWADAMTRIRTQRELLDLRYSVERQKLMFSAAGKPANVDFYSSTMKVDLALLHEEDLLRFLADLRQSGNAFYSVRRCDLTRTGQAVGGATMTPRLRALCDIDLITIVDRAAKK
jgi:DNA-binding SARP family transcriptional activator